MEDNVQQNKDIQNGLHRIILLRRYQWGTFFSFIPITILIFIIRPADWIISIICGLWAATFVIVGIIHAFVRCPACGKLFNTGNPFTPKCMKCAISLMVNKPKSCI